MNEPTQQPIAAQRAALQAVLAVMQQHPDLPGGYITQSSHITDRVDVLLGGFADVEAWREALGVAPEDVEDRAAGEERMLEVAAPVGGVTVRVYALGRRLAVAA